MVACYLPQKHIIFSKYLYQYRIFLSNLLALLKSFLSQLSISKINQKGRESTTHGQSLLLAVHLLFKGEVVLTNSFIQFNSSMVTSELSRKSLAILRASLTGTHVNGLETSKDTSFELGGTMMDFRVCESSIEFWIPKLGECVDMLQKREFNL
jgi:hypothetical protein